jgi:hypothetical protein
MISPSPRAASWPPASRRSRTDGDLAEQPSHHHRHLVAFAAPGGYGQPGDHALAAGFAAHLTEPVPFDGLIEALEGAS